MYVSSYHSSLAKNYHISLPCRPTTPRRRFGLAAAIPEVWIQVRKPSESRHMTAESVTLYRVPFV
jgi:hypothetical protein